MKLTITYIEDGVEKVEHFSSNSATHFVYKHPQKYLEIYNDLGSVTCFVSGVKSVEIGD